MKTLKAVRVGETVHVVKLHGEGAVKRRIMDMGLTKGCLLYTSVAMGSFATTEAVEGVSMKDALFGTFDSIVSGQKDVASWKEAVIKASNSLRAALKK